MTLRFYSGAGERSGYVHLTCGTSKTRLALGQKSTNQGGCEMKSMMIAAMLAVLALPAAADAKQRSCSIQDLAGHWIFATEVGHFPAFGGDITALGTMDIDGEGNVNGKFDATVSTVASLKGVLYHGSVTVDPDCTGTLVFQTSAGTTRTDSIAIVSHREILGMSQDPGNLWTYRVRRISIER